MRIAYIISAYKLPGQLVRLVRKLNAENTIFFIHVDKKTDNTTYGKMTEPLDRYGNVYFLNRHVCNWGDFGHVSATLNGIREILVQRIHYDYVILLTGQDYPIKSNTHIQRFLDESSGQSYLRYHSFPVDLWKDENGGLDRVAYWHFHWLGRHLAFPKKDQFESPIPSLLWSALAAMFPFRRKLPGNVELFGGSSYWCLSRECVEYVYEWTQHNQAFVEFFRHVHIPDEIFFHTILMNSPLRHRLVNDHLRYVDWSRPNPPYPAVLCTQDFERFIHTHNLFARKFDVTVDTDVLDMIDQATL
jgi:hypothetical protein